MTDTNDDLDPQLREVVEEFRTAGVPPWHALSVESARRLEDELFSAGEGPEMGLVREFEIEGPGGELPIRAYRPEAETTEALPTLVFYHGGGWTLGTLDSADDICRELAARVGCLVLSVDYRLAPEHPFPAAVEDAFAALEWAATHADSLGGDLNRLSVAGTSAGGNLAAATAIRAAEGGPNLACQALLYPMIDHDFTRESYRQHGNGPLLTREDVAWFWDSYLASPADAHNPLAAVLRVPDLSDLAPAVVVTAGFDVLRDEGVAYARRLDDAGVRTEHRHYPTLSHGFLSLTDDVDRADEAMEEVAEAVRELL